MDLIVCCAVYLFPLLSLSFSLLYTFLNSVLCPIRSLFRGVSFLFFSSIFRYHPHLWRAQCKKWCSRTRRTRPRTPKVVVPADRWIHKRDGTMMMIRSGDDVEWSGGYRRGTQIDRRIAMLNYYNDNYYDEYFKQQKQNSLLRLLLQLLFTSLLFHVVMLCQDYYLRMFIHRFEVWGDECVGGDISCRCNIFTALLLALSVYNSKEWVEGGDCIFL